MGMFDGFILTNLMRSKRQAKRQHKEAMRMQAFTWEDGHAKGYREGWQAGQQDLIRHLKAKGLLPTWY